MPGVIMIPCEDGSRNRALSATPGVNEATKQIRHLAKLIVPKMIVGSLELSL